VNDEPTCQLSPAQVSVLKFAAHRQLARWAKQREMSPRRYAQRAALVGAVRTLEQQAFARGCELRATSEGHPRDATEAR
jgi:hypothetical protein